MHPILRSILAVLAGVVVAFALVAGIEAIGHSVYPPPPDLDFSNAEQLRAYVLNLPVGALLFVLAGWLAAAFAGGFAAAWIARRRPMLFAGLVGALVLAASVANLVMIPHPVWFAVAAIVLLLLVTFAAGRLAPRPKAA